MNIRLRRRVSASLPLLAIMRQHQADYSSKKWWLGAELNRRHKDFQSSALPTELPSQPTKRVLFRRPRICLVPSEFATSHYQVARAEKHYLGIACSTLFARFSLTPRL